MRELLERWASVPDDAALQDDFEGQVIIQHPRCYEHSPGEPDGYCVVHGGFWHGYRVNPDRAADRAHILAAVIEATEARGWMWTLDHPLPLGGYVGTVWAADGAIGDVVTTEGPAHALLAAYLQCIDNPNELMEEE